MQPDAALSGAGIFQQRCPIDAMTMLILAQDSTMTATPPVAPAAVPDESAWFGFDDVFWITVLVIFLSAIVSAVLRLRLRDKCLKLLHGYHMTYLGGQSLTIWGDLCVVNKGLEIVFDAPYQTARGHIKRSTLIYEDEFKAAVALVRSPHGLSEREARERQRQIERTFRPGRLRRAARFIRNLLNTIRDAFTRTLSLFTGQIAKARPTGAAITSQKAQVDQIGDALIGFVANAYEALLERHIGKPVILEFRNPAGGAPLFEAPGYLVDYSDQFVAVFNAEYRVNERVILTGASASPQANPNPDAAPGAVSTPNTIATPNPNPNPNPNIRVEREDRHINVICDGHDAAVLVRMTRDGGPARDLGLSLLKGCSVRLPCPRESSFEVEVELSPSVDIVCPRSTARVRFARGDSTTRPAGRGRTKDENGARRDWRGVAPDIDDTIERERSPLQALRRRVQSGLAAAKPNSAPPLPPPPPTESRGKSREELSR